jgi:hypothetical protein
VLSSKPATYSTKVTVTGPIPRKQGRVHTEIGRHELFQKAYKESQNAAQGTELSACRSPSWSSSELKWWWVCLRSIRNSINQRRLGLVGVGDLPPCLQCTPCRSARLQCPGHASGLRPHLNCASSNMEWLGRWRLSLFFNAGHHSARMCHAECLIQEFLGMPRGHGSWLPKEVG